MRPKWRDVGGGPDFDTLPPTVQDKALMGALKNPGLSMLALRDKVKAKLTLDEAAEADRCGRS